MLGVLTNTGCSLALQEVSLLEQVVDQFVDKGLMTMLVGSLCNKVAAARKAVATAKSEQLDNTKTALTAGRDPDDEAAAAAVTEAAIATLADGSWSYIEVLREILLTLRVFASAASTYFEGKLAEKLWHALMVNPPYHEDQLGATQVRYSPRHSCFQCEETTSIMSVHTAGITRLT